MAPSSGRVACQGSEAQGPAQGGLKTGTEGSHLPSSSRLPSSSHRSSSSRSPSSSSNSNSNSRRRHRHSSQQRPSPSHRRFGMIAGSSSSIQVENKKGSEDRSEIGWKMTGTAMGTGTMRERIALVSGESGEGGVPTATGTETWTREIDAVAGTETEREIPEIESRVERRKRTEGRRSPR